LFVAGCDRAKASKDAKPPAVPPAPAVVVARVVQRDAPILRDFVARTEAVPTVEIRARVAGVLEQVRFREGSEVKKGQVLFVIQRTAIQLAEAAVESAKAAVIRADLDLTYTVVESPISGIISKVAVDRGNLVGKTEATLLATVSAVDPMFVDFSVTEADYMRVVKRAPWVARGELRRDIPPALELVLADGTTSPHKGRYVFVDRAVDVKTGTIP